LKKSPKTEEESCYIKHKSIKLT